MEDLFTSLFDKITEMQQPRPLGHQANTPVLVPHQSIDALDLERFAAAPDAKRGVFTFYSPASFAAYVNQQKTGATKIFTSNRFDKNAQALTVATAIFDAHGVALDNPNSAAGWHAHRAELSLRHTTIWQTWMAFDQKHMSQKAFAEFIEDNVIDIIRPDHATMIEVSKTFQATQSVNFKKSTRLDNGDIGLAYEQTTEAKAGQKGDIEIPGTFTIGIPMFDGTSAVTIEARLRHDIDGGNLKLWYALLRPDRVRDLTVEAVLANLETDTGLPSLLGTAPKSVGRSST